ncbi:MAG: hypothetical protein ABH810_02300 [bacterium]
MSKKNKKKLRKILRAQMERNSRENRSLDSTAGKVCVPPANPLEMTNDRSKLDSLATTEQKEQSPKVQDQTPENQHEVTSEIKKILITMGITVLAIVVIYFINIKTDLILKAGEWMIVKLNLSI